MMMKLALGGYPENQDIRPKYSSIYQNDIRVNIQDVGYHPTMIFGTLISKNYVGYKDVDVWL